MIGWLTRRRKPVTVVVIAVAVLAVYWALPISGQVIVIPESRQETAIWPKITADVAQTSTGAHYDVEVLDSVPWGYVLVTVDGQPAHLNGVVQQSAGVWRWSFGLDTTAIDGVGSVGTALVFYRDCETGCVERGRMVMGRQTKGGGASPGAGYGVATKLGLAFANPGRDWHGRQGWDVELTYARLADDPYWGVDALAYRVSRATAKGLRVIVRVDFDRGQSLPPPGDSLAIGYYLRYCGRLAADDRLKDVYGYVVGSGFNALDANQLASTADGPVNARWYARVFNGYSEDARRTDNVVQVVHAENPRARVLVGPVRPWIRDQNGEVTSAVADEPWLNYMATLVAAVGESARAKSAVGMPLAGPDGFAVQAPGRPDSPGLGGGGADEPRTDIRVGGAERGFRIYRDWLSIVNSDESTSGLPLYITSTNTQTPDDGTPPSQNYPRGWLTSALAVVDSEPQIQALCWFLDSPLGDHQWDDFSLSLRTGRLTDAAQEFDALLQAGR